VPKIGDLGLALILEKNQRLKIYRGTPDYMVNAQKQKK
jgi:hypothetical protein